MMHEQNDLKKAYNWLGSNTKELAKLDVGEFIRYGKGNVSKMVAELSATETTPKLISAESKPILPQPITRLRTHDTSTTIAKLVIVAIFAVLMLKIL